MLDLVEALAGPRPRVHRVHAFQRAQDRLDVQHLRQYEQPQDGGKLTITSNRAVVDPNTSPHWGTEYWAKLYVPDGRVLSIRDSAGITGDGSLGPVLDAPALTKAQLRDLALRPEQWAKPKAS